MTDNDLVINIDDLVVFNDSPAFNMPNILPKKLNIDTPIKSTITDGKYK